MVETNGAAQTARPVRAKEESIDVGIIVRRSPPQMKWAGEEWRPIAVIPAAPEASWVEIGREGEAIDYHAETLPLTLHRAEVSGYAVTLQMDEPSVFVGLSPVEDGSAEIPWEVAFVSVSAHDAQDYLDGEDVIVEAVPMPPELAAWLADFVAAHHKEEAFRKRKRKGVEEEGHEAWIGDVRASAREIFLPPSARRKPADETDGEDR